MFIIYLYNNKSDILENGLVFFLMCFVSVFLMLFYNLRIFLKNLENALVFDRFFLIKQRRDCWCQTLTSHGCHCIERRYQNHIRTLEKTCRILCSCRPGLAILYSVLYTMSQKWAAISTLWKYFLTYKETFHRRKLLLGQCTVH